jgi:hypothetical protein
MTLICLSKENVHNTSPRLLKQLILELKFYVIYLEMLQLFPSSIYDIVA